jgi:hypothetical protein
MYFDLRNAVETTERGAEAGGKKPHGCLKTMVNTMHLCQSEYQKSLNCGDNVPPAEMFD